jgi:SAM-dependent methyltransferase
VLRSFRRLARLPFEFQTKRRRVAELGAARDVLAASGELKEAEQRLLTGVDIRVAARDSMYERGRGPHYLKVGLSALRCIDQARGPRDAPRSVLDFGSGYGRVLRFLQIRFSGSALTAADVDPLAVGFCTTTFGVRGLKSLDMFDELSLSERYDLIWCGSLLTHLSAESASSLLGFFARHLTTEGVCVASTHGEVTIGSLRSGTHGYGLPHDSIQKVLADLDATGYGYADYGRTSSYGISVASQERMTEMAESASLKIANVQPRGWDDHHDVYGFTPAS